MRSPAMRWLQGVIGVLFAAFGFFCLDYTKAFDVDHHVAWANAHGLPAPSYPIFLLGAAAGGLGTALLGNALAKRRSPSS